MNLSTAYLTLDRYDDASAAAREAVRLAPGDAIAQFNLGLSYVELKHFEAGIGALERSVDINPRSAYHVGYLGHVYFEAGRVVDAKGTLEKAVAIKPARFESFFDLSRVFAALGDEDEADATLARGLGADPSGADEFYREHSKDDAAGDRDDESSAAGLNRLGVLCLDTNRVDDAIGHFRRAIAIDANYAPAFANLGRAMSTRKNFEAAAAYYRQASELAPQAPAPKCNLATALLQLGRYREAVDASSAALTIKPDYAEALYALGMASLGLGDKAAARDAHRRLVRLDLSLAAALDTSIDAK